MVSSSRRDTGVRRSRYGGGSMPLLHVFERSHICFLDIIVRDDTILSPRFRIARNVASAVLACKRGADRLSAPGGVYISSPPASDGERCDSA